MLHVNIRLTLAHITYTRALPRQLEYFLLWSGQDGVQMFFVVSGFLITSIALRRWGSLPEISVRDFYWLRFARIAPLLLALLALLSVLHFAHVPYFVVSAKQGGLGRAIFAALTFHLNLLEAQRGYLPANWDVLWSLSVEETFYFFFPLVCWLVGRSKAFVAVLLGLVVMGPIGRVLSQGNPIWNEKSYLGSMDAIAIGCLTALIVARFRFSRRALWAIGCAGVFLLYFCMGLSVHSYHWGLSRYGSYMSVLAVGTALFIVATTQARWRSPGILRPLMKLGQYSYEIYLTHMFVVFPLFWLYLAMGKPKHLVALLFVAAVALSGLLGMLVARIYSEPMNRYLRQQSQNAQTQVASVVDTPGVVPSEGASVQENAV
jgi:peptidoglycan/LPS O-acetylase OafA/YrhL